MLGSGKKRKQQQTEELPSPERGTKIIKQTKWQTWSSRTAVEDESPTWETQGNSTVLSLLSGQSVLFHGQAIISVEEGALEVAGAHLTTASPPLAVSTGGSCGMPIALTADVAGGAEIPLLQAHCQQAVQVRLQPPPNATPQLQLTPGGGSSSSCSSSFQLQRLQPDSDAAAVAGALAIPDEWQHALASLAEAAAECSSDYSQGPLCVAVAGVKGAGKSTFARLLVNQLLQVCPVVAYLDTDCGQPEFTPAGMVSLHLLERPVVGPPHTHPRRPEAAHYLGDTSPQSHPQLYTASVLSLHRWYLGLRQRQGQQQQRLPPLVLNTHGWIRGQGLEMLGEILRGVEPTHLVQVRILPDKKNLPSGSHFWLQQQQPGEPPAARPAPRTELVELQSAARLHGQEDEEGEDDLPSTSMGAAAAAGPAAAAAPRSGARGRSLKPIESRALMWHAWAKAVLGWSPTWGSYDSHDFRQVGQALAAHPPYVVDLEDVGVEVMHTNVAPSHIGYALNCAVVGLLAADPGRAVAVAGGRQGSSARQQQQQQRQAGCGADSAAASDMVSGADSMGGDGLAPVDVQLQDVAAAERAAEAALWPQQSGAPAAATQAQNGSSTSGQQPQTALQRQRSAEAATTRAQPGASAAAHLRSQAAAAAGSEVAPGLCDQPLGFGAQLLSASSRPAGRCLGLGIVRGVDMARRQLLLLTDVPEELLQEVDMVQVGRFDLPTSLLHAGDLAPPYLQLFSLPSDAAGAGTVNSRRNIGRASQQAGAGR